MIGGVSTKRGDLAVVPPHRGEELPHKEKPGVSGFSVLQRRGSFPQPSGYAKTPQPPRKQRFGHAFSRCYRGRGISPLLFVTRNRAGLGQQTGLPRDFQTPKIAGTEHCAKLCESLGGVTGRSNVTRATFPLLETLCFPLSRRADPERTDTLHFSGSLGRHPFLPLSAVSRSDGLRVARLVSPVCDKRIVTR